MPSSVTQRPQTYHDLFNSKAVESQQASKQKQGLWRVLDGIGSQISSYLKEIKSVNNSELNTKVESLKNALGAVKIFTDHTKKAVPLFVSHEKPYVQQLEVLNKDLTLLSNDFSKFETELTKEKDSTSLNLLMERLHTHGKTFQSYTKTVKEESDRLQAKMDLYAGAPIASEEIIDNIALRIRKFVPEYIIKDALEASKNKDSVRKERYEALKKEWLEGSLAFQISAAVGMKCDFYLQVLPQINLFEQEYTQLKTEVEAAAGKLKQINILGFAKDFIAKDKGKKRDLANFQKLVKENDIVTTVETLKDKLNALNTKKSEFYLKVMELLETLSKIPENLKAEDSSSEINLEDQTFKTQVKEIKQNSLDNLKKLKEAIEGRWNQYCLNLDKLNFEFDLLKTTRSIQTRLGASYLNLEEIRGTLRDTRRGMGETDTAVYHKKQLDSELKTYSKERESLIRLLGVYPATEIDLQTRLTSVDRKATPTPQEIGRVGILCDSKTGSSVLKQQEEQNQLFAATIKALQKHLIECKLKLKEMSELTVLEFNRMGSTLSSKKNVQGYPNNFSRAYPPESSIGGALLSVASSWGGAASSSDQPNQVIDLATSTMQSLDQGNWVDLVSTL